MMDKRIYVIDQFGDNLWIRTSNVYDTLDEAHARFDNLTKLHPAVDFRIREVITTEYIVRSTHSKERAA